MRARKAAWRRGARKYDWPGRRSGTTGTGLSGRRERSCRSTSRRSLPHGYAVWREPGRQSRTGPQLRGTRRR
eukprot:4737351-Lingulodinium_polyedra.AAC.1